MQRLCRVSKEGSNRTAIFSYQGSLLVVVCQRKNHLRDHFEPGSPHFIHLGEVRLAGLMGGNLPT